MNTKELQRIKLVLFDFDGTLYAGGGMARHVILADLLHCLWSHAERKVRKAMAGHDFGNGTEWQSEHSRLMAEETGKSVGRMEQWYKQSYMPAMVEILRKHYPARPGAAEAFEALKAKGVCVGVFSDYPMSAERMEAIGLGGMADRIWCAEDMGALKPATRPFLEILAQTNLSADEVLMIGDRADTDGLGATSAGIKCLLVKGKHSANDSGIEEMEWADIVGLLKS